ncbi:MAG: T9SS type A sorting domain-containing protein [Bacteroidota bacterium]
MKKNLLFQCSISSVVCSILFLSVLVSVNTNAQNLVSNPGFETFSTCPNNASQLDFATGWISSSYSPDYFDACGGNGTTAGAPANICGYQQPASGDGYIGMLCYGSFASTLIANLREYATGTLTTPLTVGVTYNVSFKVVLMNMSSHQCDHVGAKFMTTSTTNLGITNSAQVFSTVPISDTLNWTTISGTFVADSAYNFIVIGNHFDDASTFADSIQPVTFGWNAYYFIDDVEVTELSQPPVALFTAPNHICPGTCIDFTNLTTNGNSYLWSFTGGIPSTSTDMNPLTICYNVPGNYPVQLIATNANGSDTLTLNNYITVYPYPSPQGISQGGDTLFAIAGGGSYQWFFNSNIIPGATDYFYVAPSSGDYNVVCTDGNGCEVEAVIFDVVAGIQAAVGSGQLAIFPNPVEDKFTIHNSLPIAIGITIGKAVEISIYNMIGELIIQPQTSGLTPESVIDVSQLTDGVYWLKLQTDNKIFHAKFVKSTYRQ